MGLKGEPYIGVSGIETPKQLGRMTTTYSQKGDIPQLLMIGVIVSYKTLIGLKDKPIVLMKKEIRNIFEELKKQDSKDLFFTLHYFTKPLDEVRPELREKAKRVVEKSLHQQISEVFEDIYADYEKTEPSFQMGVQINVSRPEPKEINKIKADYPSLKTILQVSDFTSLNERIGNYDVDYVLIDKSKGRGMEFDIDGATKVYDIIKNNNPATIVFAGGLSPDNVRERVCSIRKRLDTRDFCIDAEGRLRTKNHLDEDKVEKYLKEAMAAFQQ